MWTPLYEKYGVDAVFSGHDHCYSRGEKNGVQYFVSGGGGAPLYPRDPRPDPLDLNTVVYFERTLNYLRVHVVGDFVEIDSVRGDGTLIETTSWGTMPTRVARRDVAVTAPVPTPVVVAGPLPASASGSSRGCGVSAPAGRGAGAAGWLALLFGVSWVALRCRTPAPTSSRKS